jgi:tetratricopeptide (TPR) repeat protein
MTDEPINMPLEFKLRLSAAKLRVSAARAGGNRLALANALKELGNIERRPPQLREASNRTFAEAAELYRELEMPLEAAWVKRHIGINLEYAGRLEEAERYYDEALALYRKHSAEDDLNYANAVRYPAVIKERLGKKDESAKLWEEAHDRYARVRSDGLGEGVAEAAAWLTILAIERDEIDVASKWFARASEAAARSGDPDTHKFVAEVRDRLKKAKT